MTKPITLRFASALALVAAFSACEKKAADQPVNEDLPPFYEHVAEALPEDVEKRQIAFEQKLAEAAAAAALDNLSDGFGTEASVFVKDYRRWIPGSVVTVAFPAVTSLNPDEQRLRTNIELLAKDWLGQNAANLTLNFRNADGSFRQWSPNDTSYAADIRISFDRVGYWSGIGSFSKTPEVFRTNEPSMNFARFVTDRPPNWQRVVRHEFGHALGFMHEHQNENVDCRFRYDDDPGYVRTQSARRAFVPDSSGRRPGLITWFSGYPNFWNEAKVRANLGPIGTTSIYTPDDFIHRPFDRASIMKYYFEPDFFINRERSPCFTAEAQVLSAEDKSSAALAYQTAGLERRIESFDILDSSPALPIDVRRRAAAEGRELREAAR